MLNPPPPPSLFSPFSALPYDSWRTGALSCILNIPQSSSNTLGLNKYILKVSKKNTRHYLYTIVFQALCYSITSNLKNNIILLVFKRYCCNSKKEIIRNRYFVWQICSVFWWVISKLLADRVCKSNFCLKWLPCTPVFRLNSNQGQGMRLSRCLF